MAHPLLARPLVAAALLALLAGCSARSAAQHSPAADPAPRELIVGRWANTDGVLELLPGGTLAAVLRGDTVSGSYGFLPDGRLVLSLAPRAGEEGTEESDSLAVRVSRDELALCDPGDPRRCWNFVRVTGDMAGVPLPEGLVHRHRGPSFRAQGSMILKQAYTLQEAYRARYDVYAGSMRELERVGWEDPVGLAYYQLPEVVRSGPEDLCVVIRPAPEEPEAPTLSIDAFGIIRESADCR